jgi:transposase-like protein
MNETAVDGTERRQRRRWSKEQRQEMIAAYRQSGMTRLAFCREHGLGYGSLSKWLKEEAGGSDVPKMMEAVEISPLAWMKEPVMAEVCFADGRRVRVMSGCPEALWRRMMEVMGRSAGGGSCG